MSGNIPAKLKTAPEHWQSVMIERLRETLAQVEAGEIKNLLIIRLTRDGMVSYADCGFADNHQVIGTIEMAKHAYVAREIERL